MEHFAEENRRFRNFLCLEVADCEAIGGFEVVLLSKGGLQFLNRGGKVALKEIDAAKDVSRPPVVGPRGQDPLQDRLCLVQIVAAKPDDRRIHLRLDFIGPRFQSAVQKTRGLLIFSLRGGEICELPQPEGDALTVADLGLGQISSDNEGLGLLKLPLETGGRIVVREAAGSKEQEHRERKTDALKSAN